MTTFFKNQLTSGWRNIVFKQHKLASVNFLLLDRNKQFRITGTTPQSIRAFKWVSIPLATEPKVWATAICNSNEESGFPIKWINLGKIPFSTIKCFWRLLPISDPFNWLKKWILSTLQKSKCRRVIICTLLSALIPRWMYGVVIASLPGANNVTMWTVTLH